MPVFFEKGDILGFNVDAIAIPRAPNDQMPWCNYDEVDFWNITVDVFSRADAKKMMEKFFRNRGNGYKIGADFLDEDNTERTYFIPEKYPEITVTKFCGLPVDCVFHVCVNSYAAYLMMSDDYNVCAAKEEYMLSRCYWMTLCCAARLGIKKIAFPLFSTDCPKEIAYAVAHSVPEKWLDENTVYEESNDPSCGKWMNKLKTIRNKHNAEMEIYIIEPEEKDLRRMRALYDEPSEHRPFMSEFARRLERDMTAFDGTADAFKENFIKNCFERYKKTKGKYSTLVKLTDYKTLYKFVKNPLMHPHKHRVIALAVAMELGDYERFVFIHCAGYDNYPEDERDYLVEKLISEGKRGFTELNDALIADNASYALDADVK